MSVEELFRLMRDLLAAAKVAGVDTTGLTPERGVTFDQTWGDLCGVAFYGPSAEWAAKYTSEWAKRHMGAGSYNAQRSVSVRRVWRVVARRNGVVTHHSTEPKADPSTFEVAPGWGCATVYYPGCD